MSYFMLDFDFTSNVIVLGKKVSLILFCFFILPLILYNWEKNVSYIMQNLDFAFKSVSYIMLDFDFASDFILLGGGIVIYHAGFRFYLRFYTMVLFLPQPVRIMRFQLRHPATIHYGSLTSCRMSSDIN